MGTYGLENVIRMWGAGTLSAEQTIGQLLQFIREDRERMNEIERRVARGERAPQSPGRSGKGEARGVKSGATSATRDAPDE